MLFLEKDLSVRFYNPRLRNKKQRPSRSLFFVAQKNSRRVVVREVGELECAPASDGTCFEFACEAPGGRRFRVGDNFVFPDREAVIDEGEPGEL